MCLLFMVTISQKILLLDILYERSESGLRRGVLIAMLQATLRHDECNSFTNSTADWVAGPTPEML